MTDDARTAMMEVWLAEPCPHYDGPYCPDARGGFLASGVQLCDACLADLFAQLGKVRRHNSRLHADNARLREALRSVSMEYAIPDAARSRVDAALAGAEDTDD